MFQAEVANLWPPVSGEVTNLWPRVSCGGEWCLSRASCGSEQSSTTGFKRKWPIFDHVLHFRLKYVVTDWSLSLSIFDHVFHAEVNEVFYVFHAEVNNLQPLVSGESDQSLTTCFRRKINFWPLVSGGSDQSLATCFRRKWTTFDHVFQVEVTNFWQRVSGGSEQVPGHVWDRAGGNPAPQPHERNSPFSVRGEEGSLLSHPHLRSNCHAGEPIKHLLLAYLCPAFADFVSWNIHCTHIVKKVAKCANMLKSS